MHPLREDPKPLHDDETTLVLEQMCTLRGKVTVAFDNADTADDHAAWVADIYAELGVESADLVGYSYGCFTTALVAIAAPSMVKNVIHIGPTLMYGNIPTLVLMKMLLVAITSPFPGLGLNAAWVMNSAAHGEDTIDEVTKTYLEFYEIASAVPYEYNFAMVYKFSDAELAQLATTNVTAVIPEYEVMMDVQQVTSRLMNAQIRVEIMKDAGHRVRIEDPDALLEVIARLLLAKD